MSLKKIQWGDVESDTESEESQQILEQIQGPELKSIRSEPPAYQPKLGLEDEERIQERRRMFKQQKIEQLKKLQEINNQNVWLFIFKNNNSQLAEIVQKLETIDRIENLHGWDIKVNKQMGKKLISEGFKYNKIFARILVGNRNYNNERKNDRNRDEKKRYVVKNQDKQDEDKTVQSQYTFQKKRKNNGQRNENGFVTKQSQKEKKYNNQKQVKAKKVQNSYKNNPLYEGLGDFRTKQVLKRTVSQKQPERELFNSGNLAELSQISKKVSYKKYDKPKYAQKQPKYVQKQQIKPKNKYKQKVIKESSQQQQVKILSPHVEHIQQKQSDIIQSDCSQSLTSSALQSPSKDSELACEQEQAEIILQRKQQIFTKQSSFVSQQADKIVNQQIGNIQSQEEESEEQKQPEQITKPKKKKRIRNKDKTVKVQPISNNPFDRLR